MDSDNDKWELMLGSLVEKTMSYGLQVTYEYKDDYKSLGLKFSKQEQYNRMVENRVNSIPIRTWGKKSLPAPLPASKWTVWMKFEELLKQPTQKF